VINCVVVRGSFGIDFKTNRSAFDLSWSRWDHLWCLPPSVLQITTTTSDSFGWITDLTLNPQCRLSQHNWHMKCGRIFRHNVNINCGNMDYLWYNRLNDIKNYICNDKATSTINNVCVFLSYIVDFHFQGIIAVYTTNIHLV